MYGYRKGFTLIELLVCIAVIAVISGMLLASVGTAMRKARATACVGNLRNVGYAFQMYSSDYDGYLPHEDAGASSPPTGSGWYEVLVDYLPGGFSGDESVLQCPSVGREAVKKKWRSYKMNSLLEDDETPFYRVGGCAPESRTILLFDARVDNRGVCYQSKGTWKSACARHDGRTNLLFLDFHVSSYAPPTNGCRWLGEGGFVWDPKK